VGQAHTPKHTHTHPTHTYRERQRDGNKKYILLVTGNSLISFLRILKDRLYVELKIKIVRCSVYQYNFNDIVSTYFEIVR